MTLIIPLVRMNARDKKGWKQLGYFHPYDGILPYAPDPPERLDHRLS